jgi:hypothetical protein
MKYRRFLLLWLLSLAPPLAGSAEPQAPPSSNSGVTLSNQQWQSVLSEFEVSVFSLSQWLEKSQTEKKKIQENISDLEEKIASLRKGDAGGSNVFDEIRLKNLLEELKEKLEKNSALQHQWDDKQKEFEQKALSLTALYNDRIEMELENTDSNQGVSQIDGKLTGLTVLIQKRTQVQTLLKEYAKKRDSEKLLSVASFKSFKTNDRESLQMTLDLFQDRKKDLEEQLEKWSLEMEEVKNELKLQGKMQDFLEDISRINEDSDFPQGGLKRHDLEGIVGKTQKNKLESRLAELQAKISRGQTTLLQINQLTSRVENQMNSLNERKRK